MVVKFAINLGNRNIVRREKIPYSPAQHRLFEAAAHNPKIAQQRGIPQQQAAKMASEGIKHDPKKLAQALKGK
jgi:hypothetical protein